jgi:hypothetical protein
VRPADVVTVAGPHGVRHVQVGDDTW